MGLTPDPNSLPQQRPRKMAPGWLYVADFTWTGVTQYSLYCKTPPFIFLYFFNYTP